VRKVVIKTLPSCRRNRCGSDSATFRRLPTSPPGPKGLPSTQIVPTPIAPDTVDKGFRQLLPATHKNRPFRTANGLGQNHAGEGIRKSYSLHRADIT
jgi:hypothetical protein